MRWGLSCSGLLRSVDWYLPTFWDTLAFNLLSSYLWACKAYKTSLMKEGWEVVVATGLHTIIIGGLARYHPEHPSFLYLLQY